MKEAFQSFSNDLDYLRVNQPRKMRQKLFTKKQIRNPSHVKSSRSFFNMINNKDGFYPQQPAVRPHCQTCKYQKADYYDKNERVYICEDCAQDQMRYGASDLVDLRQQGYNYPTYRQQIPRTKSARNIINPQKHYRHNSGYQNFYEKYHRKHETVEIFDRIDSYQYLLKVWLFQKRSHDDSMKTFMKNARSLLKQHYQKINQLLTQCWKQDDQALKVLQKKQAQMFKNNKQIIEQQLQALNKMKIQFEYTNESFLNNLNELKYRNFLEQIKKSIPKIASIGSWIKEDIKKTPQQLFINQRNPKILLPQTYRIINESIQIQSMQSNERNPKQILFSFDRF